jgi:hypothetical protein
VCRYSRICTPVRRWRRDRRPAMTRRMRARWCAATTGRGAACFPSSGASGAAAPMRCRPRGEPGTTPTQRSLPTTCPWTGGSGVPKSRSLVLSLRLSPFRAGSTTCSEPCAAGTWGTRRSRTWLSRRNAPRHRRSAGDGQVKPGCGGGRRGLLGHCHRGPHHAQDFAAG